MWICVVDVLNHTIVVKYYIIVAVELFFFLFAWMPLFAYVWLFMFCLFFFLHCKLWTARYEIHHSSGGEHPIPYSPLVVRVWNKANELFLGTFFRDVMYLRDFSSNWWMNAFLFSFLSTFGLYCGHFYMNVSWMKVLIFYTCCAIFRMKLPHCHNNSWLTLPHGIQSQIIFVKR